MAPKRPPEANIITLDGPIGAGGVLICRAEGSEAETMAIRALVIDLGWDHDHAVETILSATVTPGRWYKTPDRSGEHAWIMVKTDYRPHAGATPGVYYSWGF